MVGVKNLPNVSHNHVKLCYFSWYIFDILLQPDSMERLHHNPACQDSIVHYKRQVQTAFRVPRELTATRLIWFQQRNATRAQKAITAKVQW